MHRLTGQDIEEAISRSLSGFSRMDRQAFGLYAIAGYEYDEIGAVQRRPACEIEEVVAAVRETVKEGLRR